MVTTHSEEEWRLLTSLRNQGRADAGGWLEHARLGFNYRIDDVRAAIGLAQLEKLDRDPRAARAPPRRATTELLADVDGLELPCADDADHVRSWFVYVVALPPGTDREARHRGARAAGVQTARYLPCIHLQPYMRERYGFREGLCPVAEDVSARTLALPFHARIEEDDQAYVAEALGSALEVVRRGTPQGEALAVWALVAATCSPSSSSTRLDPSELYSVTHEGIAGGLGRALVQLDFPHVAGVAIPIALLALDALPRRAWLVGAPAIALCAVFAWPGSSTATISTPGRERDPRARRRPRSR